MVTSGFLSCNFSSICIQRQANLTKSTVGNLRYDLHDEMSTEASKSTRILYEGLLRGDRASLARSITLIESTHPEKRAEARKLINMVNIHAKSVGLETETFRLVVMQ